MRVKLIGRGAPKPPCQKVENVRSSDELKIRDVVEPSLDPLSRIFRPFHAAPPELQALGRAQLCGLRWGLQAILLALTEDVPHQLRASPRSQPGECSRSQWRVHGSQKQNYRGHTVTSESSCDCPSEIGGTKQASVRKRTGCDRKRAWEKVQVATGRSGRMLEGRTNNESGAKGGPPKSDTRLRSPHSHDGPPADASDMFLLLSWPLDPKEHSCKQDLCTSPQGCSGLWRRCHTFLTLLPSLLPLLLKPHQVVSNKSKPVMAGRGGWAWPWTHGMRVYSMNTVVQDTHTC